MGSICPQQILLLKLKAKYFPRTYWVQITFQGINKPCAGMAEFEEFLSMYSDLSWVSGGQVYLYASSSSCGAIFPARISGWMPQAWTSLFLDWMEDIPQIIFLGDVVPLQINHRVLVATFLGHQLFTEKESKDIFFSYANIVIHHLPWRSVAVAPQFPDWYGEVVCYALDPFGLRPLDCGKLFEDPSLGHYSLGRSRRWMFGRWSSPNCLARVQTLGPSTQMAAIWLLEILIHMFSIWTRNSLNEYHVKLTL